MSLLPAKAMPAPLAGLDDQLTLAGFDISLLPTDEYADPPEAMIRTALSLPEDASLEAVSYNMYLYAQYTAADSARYVAACSYDAQDGTKRYATEVVMNEMEFMDSKKQSAGQSAAPSSAPADQQTQLGQTVGDEDIPF